MKVDRSGGKALPETPQKSQGGTTLQKKGNKLTLNAGDQDSVHISQSQNSLKIRINEGEVLTLTPEESRNLQVAGNLKNLTIDPGVSLSLIGIDQKPNQEVAARESGGRKEERALAGQVTREILISDLKNFLAEQGEPSESKQPQDSSRMENIELNLNTLRGPEFGSGQQNSSLRLEDKEKMEPMPLASGRKEEASLTATIKKKDLSHELGDVVPEQVQAEVPGAPAGALVDEKPEPVRLTKKEAEVFVEPELQPIVLEGQRTKPGAEPPQLSKAKNQLLHFMEGDSFAPAEKAGLFKELSGESNFSVFEERGISALLSGTNTNGLPEIPSGLTGFRLAHALKDPEMKTQWDRMVSAMDYPELALNPSEAVSIAGIFHADREMLQRLTPGCIAKFLSTEAVPEAQLNVLDQRSFCCLLIENGVRLTRNQPLVQAADLRKDALEILNDGSLSNEEKLAAFDGLEKESGLSDFQMREIVMRPLSSFFQNAIHDVMEQRDSVLHNMDAKVEEAVDSFGPESVAVEIVKAEHEEALGGLDSRSLRLQNLQSVADGIFCGPLDPVVKADRVVESIVSSFFPALQTIQPEMNKILKGAVVFQTGKLESALAQIDRSGIRELKGFVQPASIFLPNIRSGAFPAMLVQLSSHPALSGDSAVAEFVPTAKFLAQLASGTFARQMQSAVEAVIERGVPEQFREPLSQIQNWRSEIANSTGNEAKQRLVKQAEELRQQFVGNLQTNVQTIARGTAELFEDPRFQTAMETIKSGSRAIIAFSKGHYAQMLSALKERVAGNAAVKQIIEQALHITNAGTPFFRGLLNREWERPLFMALKKSSGNKELQEVVGIFSDTLNLFLPLTSVENSSPFLQYQRQLSYLKDEELMNDWIHHFQNSI